MAMSGSARSMACQLRKKGWTQIQIMNYLVEHGYVKAPPPKESALVRHEKAEIQKNNPPPGPDMTGIDPQFLLFLKHAKIASQMGLDVKLNEITTFFDKKDAMQVEKPELAVDLVKVQNIEAEAQAFLGITLPQNKDLIKPDIVQKDEAPPWEEDLNEPK